MKKYICLVFVACCLFGSLNLVTSYTIKRHEARCGKVSLNKTKDKKIVFYRDDCSDCQKVYGTYFWHDFLHHDLQFVNLNNKGNRRYITEYNITTVPTIIGKTERYSGTNEPRIKELLSQ